MCYGESLTQCTKCKANDSGISFYKRFDKDECVD